MFGTGMPRSGGGCPSPWPSPPVGRGDAGGKGGSQILEGALMVPDADALYESLVARDGGVPGVLVCVRTTGIFCRMTCPARTPLLKNVEFRETVEDCVAAGFRACKRCRPQAGSPLAGSLSVTTS